MAAQENKKLLHEYVSPEMVQTFVSNGTIERIDATFEDFESGSVAFWINSLLKQIYNAFNAGNFVNDSALTNAAISIYNTYPKMKVHKFCRFVCSWLNGQQETEKAPTIPEILKRLNMFCYDDRRPEKVEYNAKHRNRMLYVMDLNKDWLFSDQEKSKENRDRIDGKRRERKTVTITEFYILDFYDPGTLAENTWAFLIEHFKEWIEKSAKLLNHEIKWYSDEIENARKAEKA